MRVRPVPFTALIDTSGYYALIDPRDGRRQEALAIQQRLIAQRYRLFTTNFILAETHALLLTRMGYGIALQTL